MPEPSLAHFLALESVAEVIVGRADSTKEHMGLHTWTDAPHGKVRMFDVVVAKNYLTEHELAQLSRLVNAYLDVAGGHGARFIGDHASR